MSYPEPAALDVQASLRSGPWGQPSPIHFSPPFKVWASTAPAHSRLGQAVGGPRMSSSACLPAQLTAHLAELNLNSSNIILQLFSSLEILRIASLSVFQLWKLGFADFWPYNRTPEFNCPMLLWNRPEITCPFSCIWQGKLWLLQTRAF